MLAIRQAVPERSPLFRTEFATLRLRLIKVAARIVEGTARIRISLPGACPDAALFRHLAGRFAAAGPYTTRRCRRTELLVETPNHVTNFKANRDEPGATGSMCAAKKWTRGRKSCQLR